MSRAGTAASIAVLAALLSVNTDARAAAPIEVGNALIPNVRGLGIDIPLTMTISNSAAVPDALLRVRCPFVNFTELRTVDYGEGAPADRAVKSIPIAANGATELTTKGFHIELLQTREQVFQDETRPCTLTFRNAGSIEISVHAGAQTAP